MDLFQQIVITTALFFLIIILLFIGFSVRNNKYKVAFPPVVANCPDYWIDQSDGDSSNCINVKDLGISSESCPKTMDFTVAPFNGSAGLCSKSLWAQNCNLTWDGVTNNLNACSNVNTQTVY